MSNFRRILLPSLLVGLIVAFLMEVRPFSPAEPWRVVVRMTSDASGRANLFFDRGNSMALQDSDAAFVEKGDQAVVFTVPDGSFAGFRFWPLDHGGNITITGAAVVSPEGKFLATFAPGGMAPTRPELGYKVVEGKGKLTSIPGEGLIFIPAAPLELKRNWLPIDPANAAMEFAAGAAAAALLLMLGGRVPAATRGRLAAMCARIRDGQETRPVATLLLVAMAATVLGCYPVIFQNRSFVSPANSATLLYDDYPTMPEAPDEPWEDVRGADTGATMWAHLPYSVIQHRAIFRDHELPLWNRWTHCGTPLLGQGQSMIGDPLHWIAIGANGAAWAWDVKFVLARFLFVLGIGLCVVAATGGLWVAALMTLSSAFLGFFAYRFNHCAIFSVCYAPWILLCWLRVARDTGRVWPWVIGIALANFWELNSGTAKESAMLIAGLNFTGALLLVCAHRPWGERWRRLAAMAWGCVIFVFLTAPHWMVFLDTLRNAWTSYQSPKAWQIQPGLAIGLFDDLFYRQTVPGEGHFNPSANFLVLLGCLWAAANFRRLLAVPAFFPLVIGAAVPAAIVFGVVPPALLLRLPFIANIQHIDNTFSCVLIIHILVLAGYGLRVLWERSRDADRAEMLTVAGLFVVLAAVYFGCAQAAQRTGNLMAAAGEKIPFSGFFLAYSASLALALLLLPQAVRSLRRRPGFAALLLAGVCMFAFHFRHAAWDGTKFDHYVMNPRTRTDLAAPSQVMNGVRAVIERSGEPARVAGLGGTLVPGYNIVAGLEHFTGADAVLSPFQRDLAEASGAVAIWDWRWILPRQRVPAARPFTDMWNVKWLVGAPHEQPKNIPGPTLNLSRDLDLYTSTTAWPRAFFTDRVITCSSFANFLELLRAGDGRPFAAISPRTATDAPNATIGQLGGRTVSAGRGYSLTSNTTTFAVDAPGPGVAVLSESFMPGDWRATVDGKPAAAFRVNHAFLGVKIDTAGTHTIRFEYWPRLLSVSLWIALSGLLLLLLTPVAAVLWRR